MVGLQQVIFTAENLNLMEIRLRSTNQESLMEYKADFKRQAYGLLQFLKGFICVTELHPSIYTQ